MNIEVRNLKLSSLAVRCALWSVFAFACGNFTIAPAKAGHSFFNSEPETLEYPGPQRFWNTAGIVISPARTIAQVNTEVPMFAGVCDGHGHLLPYEKVEWMLDKSSVGSFVTVSDAYRPFLLELVSSRPHKIDNSYAVSETLPANVILTRGTPNISDDMVMPHGYTWVTVTAAHEGVSYVTAYAPDVYGWDARQRSATIHWIDAEWQFPEPGCVPLGSHASLNTCVYRKTNKTPLSDWIVKYTVTGGAEAGFGPQRECSTEVATEKDGRASVELVPASDTAGTTCVCVELIRSECAAIGDPERLSIASSAMYVNWGTKSEAPAVSDAAVATPTPAATIAPTPAPPSAAPPMNAPAPGPAVTTPTIPQSSTVPAPQSTGMPRIELNVAGPETAELGADVTFTITATNRGNAAATNLIVLDRYDTGMQHAIRQNPIQKDLGTIAPGESTPVNITFRITRPGKLCHVVEINGPGIHEVKTACVSVTAPPPPPEHPTMEMRISVPDDQRVRRVGDQVEFTIEVANTGTTVPAQQVQVALKLEPGLHVDSITTDARLRSDGDFVYTFDNIPPNSKVTRKFACSCVAAVQRACAIVDSIDLSKLQLHADVCVQILPNQAAGIQNPLRVNVFPPLRNPARVGTEVIYRITVANTSSESQKQVQLSVSLPDNMDFISVLKGPASATIKERNLQFSPLQELRANEQQNFDVQLRAVRPGSSKLEAELRSFNQPTPVTGSEVANVVN
jgi:uncharacterized repeat protein (TIGR01451 family)